MAFERTLDSRVGPLDSPTRAVIFSDILESVDVFVASVTASLVSGGDRALAIAQSELEYMLSETSGVRLVHEALRVISDTGSPTIFDMVISLGPESLRSLLASAIETLEGYGAPDPSLLKKFAEVSRWRVDPAELEPRVAASAVLLSVAASFLRAASSS